MTKTLIASIIALSFSVSALAGEPGSFRCQARELAPGNQGRSGVVLLDEHQAVWEGVRGVNASLCQLAQFTANACFTTRSSRNLVLQVNAECGEVRQDTPMAEAQLTLATDHGRYSCIHRALGLLTAVELRNCKPL